jgi:hypothetical protein
MMGRSISMLGGFTAIVLAGLVTIGAVANQVLAHHYLEFPSHPTSQLERDFGFVTTITTPLSHGDATRDHDIDQVRRLDESLSSLTLKVRTSGAPVSSTTFINALTSASNEWDVYDTYTDQPSWSVAQDNLDVNLPSLFPECGGFGGGDGDFEAAFGSRGVNAGIAETEFSPGFEVMALDGGTDTYDEADVCFNTDADFTNDGIPDTWTVSRTNNVARHEMGHFFGHGDLYGLYTSKSQCNLVERSFGDGAIGPVMCHESNPVSVGDANGLFYLYPLGESLSMTESYNGGPADIAIAELQGSGDNTEPEFVVVEVDEDTAPTPDEQHFLAKPYLDIDENTYAENSGLQTELFSLPVSGILDVGLSFANVDGDSTRDMVLSWVESDNTGHWIVYWDVTLTGSEELDWTSASSEHIMSGLASNTEGIDTVFMNMDTDSAIEMVVITTHHNGVDDVADYHIVELSTTSGGASGSWRHFTNTGIIVEDDTVGAAIIDDAERLVAIVYSAEDLASPEYAAYNVVKFNSGGTINTFSDRQLTTHEQTDDTSSSLDGIGADAYLWPGVGLDSGATALEYKDLVVLTADETSLEFTVERDTRYNAHGTADDAGRQ